MMSWSQQPRSRRIFLLSEQGELFFKITLGKRLVLKKVMSFVQSKWPQWIQVIKIYDERETSNINIIWKFYETREIFLNLAWISGNIT